MTKRVQLLRNTHILASKYLQHPARAAFRLFQADFALPKSLLVLVAFLSVFAPPAHASAGNNNIKIIAFYGSGNSNKAQYGRDTVILFNPTQASITMTGWSLQQAGPSGSGFTVFPLPTATIPAGGYYAVAGSGTAYISGVGCTSSTCNTNYAYDVEVTKLGVAMTTADNYFTGTATTFALVSSQTAVTGTCPTTASTVVDFIGLGASDGSSPASCFAGSSYAVYSVAGTGLNAANLEYPFATIRKNRCIDTYNNSADWQLGYIDFLNSSSAPTPCPTGTQLSVTATSATPTNPGILQPLTITATVTTATGPASSGLTVTADLSELGLSSTAMLYDDGTHGDAVAGDHIYTLATAPAAASPGTVPGIFVTASDSHGDVARGIIPLTISAGSFILSTPGSATATVTAGNVATFPITLTAANGYSGYVGLTCTGSPNTNNLGLPLRTQCVSTPNQLTVAINGTTTFSLAIATGTTYSASLLPEQRLIWVSLASLLLLGFSLRKRRYLKPLLPLLALACLAFGTTACGTASGLGNTNAAPGTYTYVLTGADITTTSITNSLTFTIIVQ